MNKKLEIGDKVYIGGCHGKITVILNNFILVRGRFYYSHKNYEDWTCKIDPTEFYEFDENTNMWEVEDAHKVWC